MKIQIRSVMPYNRDSFDLYIQVENFVTGLDIAKISSSQGEDNFKDLIREKFAELLDTLRKDGPGLMDKVSQWREEG